VLTGKKGNRVGKEGGQPSGKRGTTVRQKGAERGEKGGQPRGLKGGRGTHLFA